MRRRDARAAAAAAALRQGHMIDEERSSLPHPQLMRRLLFATLIRSFGKYPSALNVHEQLKLAKKNKKMAKKDSK